MDILFLRICTFTPLFLGTVDEYILEIFCFFVVVSLECWRILLCLSTHFSRCLAILLLPYTDFSYEFSYLGICLVSLSAVLSWVLFVHTFMLIHFFNLISSFAGSLSSAKHAFCLFRLWTPLIKLDSFYKKSYSFIIPFFTQPQIPWVFLINWITPEKLEAYIHFFAL